MGFGSPIRLESTVSSPLHLTASRVSPLVRQAYTRVNTGKRINHRHSKDLMPFEDCSSSVGSADFVSRNVIGQTKHVAFGDICTRSFQVILGDHPACAHGCPITLGWDYSQCPSIPIDEYEAARQPRRRREDLRTTWDERRNMISESDEEVKRINRKLARERNCQRKVNRRTCAAFFSRESLPEDCQLTLPAVPEAECT